MLIPSDDSCVSEASCLKLKVDNENLPCSDLQCIPDCEEIKNTIVASYVSGYVRLWHYSGANPSTRLLFTIREEVMLKPSEENSNLERKTNQILSCSCSYDGKRFITGGDDCHIRVYDLQLRKLVRLCHSSFAQDKMDGHVMRICALKYHPRGSSDLNYAHIFISGGWDDTIQIWDDRYIHSLWTYFGPHISGTDALDIEPESNHILTSSWRHEKSILQVWKFNEELINNFYSKTTGTNNNDELSLPSGVEISNSSATVQLYKSPVAEIAQDGLEIPSKGYVARWLGPYFIAFGGSDSNVLRILSRLTLNVMATVTDLTNGVYSLTFMKPDVTQAKRNVCLSFASGNRIYTARLEQS